MQINKENKYKRFRFNTINKTSILRGTLSKLYENRQFTTIGKIT